MSHAAFDERRREVRSYTVGYEFAGDGVSERGEPAESLG
jgi:hypothetical protein